MCTRPCPGTRLQRGVTQALPYGHVCNYELKRTQHLMNASSVPGTLPGPGVKTDLVLT